MTDDTTLALRNAETQANRIGKPVAIVEFNGRLQVRPLDNLWGRILEVVQPVGRVA